MSAFVLKLIACTTMFIDHFGATFEFIINAENLRCIGRMAFPIYVYLISEGTRHTSDLKKYMLRLGIFAIISELPYNLLFSNSPNYPSTDFIFFDFSQQNVFFTLFFGVLGVYFWKESRKFLGEIKYLYIFLMCMTLFLGAVFNADYGLIGVAVIIVCSVIENKNTRIAWLYAIFICMYFGLSPLSIKMTLSMSLSILLIYFYNGKKGPSAKWLFYAFYPVHLLFLFGLYYFYLVCV